jgi:hypothetical protein
MEMSIPGVGNFDKEGPYSAEELRRYFSEIH